MKKIESKPKQLKVCVMVVIILLIIGLFAFSSWRQLRAINYISTEHQAAKEQISPEYKAKKGPGSPEWEASKNLGSPEHKAYLECKEKGGTGCFQLLGPPPRQRQ